VVDVVTHTTRHNPETTSWWRQAWRRIRRHVDTAWLMLAAVITGTVGLSVPGARSRAIVGSLPDAWQVIWYSGLLIGGTLGGVGVLRGGKQGMLVERPARWLLGLLCVAFGVAVIIVGGAQGVASAAFIGLFGLGCIARAYEIRLELRHPNGERALREELDSVRADLASLRAEIPHPDREVGR
jgi:hypothetical protein